MQVGYSRTMAFFKSFVTDSDGCAPFDSHFLMFGASSETSFEIGL